MSFGLRKTIDDTTSRNGLSVAVIRITNRQVSKQPLMMPVTMRTDKSYITITKNSYCQMSQFA